MLLRDEASSAAVVRSWLAIRQDLGLSLPYLDNYALPQPAYVEEVGDGLYNTERDYLEQLEAYKTFQGKLQLE